jgi:hypothetical protein
MTVCESCGVVLAIGDYPFCPHGHGRPNVEAVTWPGGRVFENLGHDPVRCDSPADLRRELTARGLEPMVRHVDGSPHTRSWATTDPYTLEQGRILAERQATTRTRGGEDPPDPATVAIVRDVLARSK